MLWGYLLIFQLADGKDCKIDPKSKLYCQQSKCSLATPKIVAVTGTPTVFSIGCSTDCADIDNALTYYKRKPIHCPSLAVNHIRFEPADAHVVVKRLEDNNFEFRLRVTEEKPLSQLNIELDFETTCRVLYGEDCNWFEDIYSECVHDCMDIEAKHKSQRHTEIWQLQVTTINTCLCSEELLTNEFCDPECNSAACDFDRGVCNRPEEIQVNAIAALVLISLGCVAVFACFCFCFLRKQRLLDC